MRKKLVFIWLASAIGLFCVHYGPGQNWLRADRAARLDTQAQALEQAGQWEEARSVYEQALAALPEEGYEKQRVALGISRAWTYLNTQDVAETTAQFESLLEATRREEIADPDLMCDLRAALAHAEYYTAWHMRLESAPRKAWLKELEVARQNFRYLAEKGGDFSACRNLEAAVFLARMDQKKLEGLPLPEDNAGSGSQNVSEQRGEGQPGEGQPGEGQPGEGEPGEGEGEGEGKGENKQKLEDARGRGLGKRPEGIGS